MSFISKWTTTWVELKKSFYNFDGNHENQERRDSRIQRVAAVLARRRRRRT